MADFYDRLSDKLTAFIVAQPMFFVATAAPGARINLSPKGMDTFRVLDPARCAYLDITGSGNETAAHIKADGRITIMFNSFTQQPLIVRLYGRGSVARPGAPDFKAHLARFPRLAGVRQIIFIDIESVQTSCGFGVPQMGPPRERATLMRWVEGKGAAGIAKYQQARNSKSIDGLDTGLAE